MFTKFVMTRIAHGPSAHLLARPFRAFSITCRITVLPLPCKTAASLFPPKRFPSPAAKMADKKRLFFESIVHTIQLDLDIRP
jgi:hypothetical protein